MGRLAQFKKMVSESRLGFEIDEVMTGRHEFEPGFGEPGYRPMEFRVTWGHSHLSKWLNPRNGEFLNGPLRGKVTIGGLCVDAPCEGTLQLRYFTDHKIRYAFEFRSMGKDYSFVGEKVNIQLWNLPVSHTTCMGRLTESKTGKLVSTSVTHFRFLSAPAFLASMRLV